MSRRSVRFTVKAKEDLRAIAAYTRRRFGAKQAKGYLAHTRELSRLLAEDPNLGRPEPGIKGIFRLELSTAYRASHVLFFQRTGGRVLVVRVLHARMLPTRYLDPEE